MAGPQIEQVDQRTQIQSRIQRMAPGACCKTDAPTAGRFYRPFRVGMRETERCPRCDLNLKTGKFE